MPIQSKDRPIDEKDMQLTLYYYSTLSMLLDIKEQDVLTFIQKDNPSAFECLIVSLWSTHVSEQTFDRDKCEKLILSGEEGEHVLPYMLFGGNKFSKKMFAAIKDRDTLSAIRSYTGLTQRVIKAYKGNATPEVFNLSLSEDINEIDALECLSKLSVAEMAEEDIKKKTLLRYEMGNVTSMYLSARAFADSVDAANEVVAT